MKVVTILVFAIIPFWGKAQFFIDFSESKNKAAKGCDTCNEYFAYNSESPVSYVLPNVLTNIQFAPLFEIFGNGFPNVTKHFTGLGEFSVLFLPSYLGSGSTAVWPEQTKGTDYGVLQFSILHNGTTVKNWSDIQLLKEEKDYIAHYKIKNRNGNDSSVGWKVYNAGKFNLKIGDSVIVLIRGSFDQKVVQSIFVKRIKEVPIYFDFIKFSSSQVLQDILNTETFKEGIKGESTIEFEIEPGDIALLKFRDFKVQNNELEYAFADKPGIWTRLKMNRKEIRPGQPCYISLNNLPPGKTTELLLRYTSQRESVHPITIKVKEKVVNNNIWLKVAVAIAILSLSFAFWSMYKRLKHAKVLRQLTLNKEETESKLQLLSGQLNPHFLFNSLNSVQNLINKQDTEQANQYVAEVSTFLRTIMDAGKKEYISLKEELEIETYYMKLEQKRMTFQYAIINKCDNDLAEVEFPPSLLQPVIENSIHHGFTKDIQHPLITIRISCVEKQLLVIVEDNGQGFNPHVVKQGHGLTIVQNRISLINKKLNAMPVEMQVQSSGAGTVTTFTFQNWL
jgi:hypothetical protein